MHLLRPPGVLEEALETPHADRFSNTVRRLSPADHSIIARHGVTASRRHGYSWREFDRPPRRRP